jgi:ssDNA-binding Zn-finger/Zn-ribbon topoisomerase 1
MMKFYGLWLGGLAAMAFVLSRVGFAETFPIASIIGAISYLVLVPYYSQRFYWKKYDRFLRCPKCRDWLAADANGSRVYPPPNPGWQVVIATGRCPKCGTRILSEAAQSGGQSRNTGDRKAGSA